MTGADAPTREGFAKAVKRLYAERAEEILKAYSAATDEEIRQAATDLAGDRFIGYSTWKLADLQGRTGGKPSIATCMPARVRRCAPRWATRSPGSPAV